MRRFLRSEMARGKRTILKTVHKDEFNLGKRFSVLVKRNEVHPKMRFEEHLITVYPQKYLRSPSTNVRRYKDYKLEFDGTLLECDRETGCAVFEDVSFPLQVCTSCCVTNCRYTRTSLLNNKHTGFEKEKEAVEGGPEGYRVCQGGFRIQIKHTRIYFSYL